MRKISVGVFLMIVSGFHASIIMWDDPVNISGDTKPNLAIESWATGYADLVSSTSSSLDYTVRVR